MIGSALGGVATAGVYVVLGVLLAVGWVALSVAGTAVFALRSAAASLQQLMYSVNQCYEEGPVLLRLPGLLRRGRGPDPGVGRDRRPGRVRADHRLRGDLLLPGRRRARHCARCRSRSAGARWSPWSARTGRARPPWPRSWPGCTGRRPGTVRWDGTRHRRRARRAAAGTDRRHRPGPRQLAADRPGQHHDGAAAGRRRCSSSAAAASGADAVIGAARQRLRHAAGPRVQGRRRAVRRPVAADRRRPRLLPHRPAADHGRADRRARRPGRVRAVLLAAHAGPGPHGADHHPPAGLGPARRPDLRAGPRPGGRVRQPRRADGPRRPVRRALHPAGVAVRSRRPGRVVRRERPVSGRRAARPAGPGPPRGRRRRTARPPRPSRPRRPGAARSSPGGPRRAAGRSGQDPSRSAPPARRAGPRTTAGGTWPRDARRPTGWRTTSCRRTNQDGVPCDSRSVASGSARQISRSRAARSVSTVSAFHPRDRCPRLTRPRRGKSLARGEHGVMGVVGGDG